MLPRLQGRVRSRWKRPVWPPLKAYGGCAVPQAMHGSRKIACRAWPARIFLRLHCCGLRVDESLRIAVRRELAEAFDNVGHDCWLQVIAAGS